MDRLAARWIANTLDEMNDRLAVLDSLRKNEARAINKYLDEIDDFTDDKIGREAVTEAIDECHNRIFEYTLEYMALSDIVKYTEERLGRLRKIV